MEERKGWRRKDAKRRGWSSAVRRGGVDRSFLCNEVWGCDFYSV
jgi:hypothetical protein